MRRFYTPSPVGLRTPLFKPMLSIHALAFNSMRTLASACFCLMCLSLALSTGCTTFHKEPAVSPTQAQETILQSRSLHYSPDTLRLTAKVDYYDGSQNKRVVGRDFIISAQAPANLRVTLSSFDKALSTLVTNGNTFGLLDAMNDVFVTGRATPANLAQLLPLYLSAHDIFRVLTAQYPDENVSENTPHDLVWDTGVGAYKLTLNLKDGRTERVYFAYPSGDIVKMTISLADEIQYEYTADDFETYSPEQDDDIMDEDVKSSSPAPAIRLPKTILFKLKPEKTDVRLRIDQYTLDCEFAPQVFDLFPPSGTRIVVLHDDPIPVTTTTSSVHADGDSDSNTRDDAEQPLPKSGNNPQDDTEQPFPNAG